MRRETRREGTFQGKTDRDHSDVFVAFHDALDAREREIVVRLEALLCRDLQRLHVDAYEEFSSPKGANPEKRTLFPPELFEKGVHLSHVLVIVQVVRDDRRHTFEKALQQAGPTPASRD